MAQKQAMLVQCYLLLDPPHLFYPNQRWVGERRVGYLPDTNIHLHRTSSGEQDRETPLLLLLLFLLGAVRDR